MTMTRKTLHGWIGAHFGAVRKENHATLASAEAEMTVDLRRFDEPQQPIRANHLAVHEAGPCPECRNTGWVTLLVTRSRCRSCHSCRSVDEESLIALSIVPLVPVDLEALRATIVSHVGLAPEDVEIGLEVARRPHVHVRVPGLGGKARRRLCAVCRLTLGPEVLWTIREDDEM